MPAGRCLAMVVGKKGGGGRKSSKVSVSIEVVPSSQQKTMRKGAKGGAVSAAVLQKISDTSAMPIQPTYQTPSIFGEDPKGKHTAIFAPPISLDVMSYVGAVVLWWRFIRCTKQSIMNHECE